MTERTRETSFNGNRICQEGHALEKLIKPATWSSAKPSTLPAKRTQRRIQRVEVVPPHFYDGHILYHLNEAANEIRPHRR